MWKDLLGRSGIEGLSSLCVHIGVRVEFEDCYGVLYYL